MITAGWHVVGRWCKVARAVNRWLTVGLPAVLWPLTVKMAVASPSQLILEREGSVVCSRTPRRGRCNGQTGEEWSGWTRHSIHVCVSSSAALWVPDPLTLALLACCTSEELAVEEGKGPKQEWEACSYIYIWLLTFTFFILSLFPFIHWRLFLRRHVMINI